MADQDSGHSLRERYDNISSERDLERLIREGTAEDQILEAKRVVVPGDCDPYIAKEFSAFSNSGGGIFLFGVGTQRIDNVDRLVDLYPFPDASKLPNYISKKLVHLIAPSSIKVISKYIPATEGRMSGYCVTCIFNNENEPIMDLRSKKFWIRAGDETKEMPYEMIRRYFQSSEGPNVSATLKCDIVDGGKYALTPVLTNSSWNVASNISIFLEFMNESENPKISSIGRWHDVATANEGRQVYNLSAQNLFHEMRLWLDKISIFPAERLNGRFTPFIVKISLYTDKMATRKFYYLVHIFKNGRIDVKELSP